MKETTVSFEGVSKKYGAHEVLRGISFSLRRGHAQRGEKLVGLRFAQRHRGYRGGRTSLLCTEGFYMWQLVLSLFLASVP